MGPSAKGDAGLPAEEGVPVRIPIDRRLRDGLNDLGPGLEAMPGTPEQFAAYIKSEIARFTKIAKAAGIKAE